MKKRDTNHNGVALSAKYHRQLRYSNVSQANNTENNAPMVQNDCWSTNILPRKELGANSANNVWNGKQKGIQTKFQINLEFRIYSQPTHQTPEQINIQMLEKQRIYGRETLNIADCASADEYANQEPHEHHEYQIG